MLKGAAGVRTPHPFHCPRDLMRLLLASPFLPPDFDGWLTKRTTIQQIFRDVDDLEWAEEFAIVRLNGTNVPRAWWPHVTVKPEADGCLWICPVPQKGNLLPILAAVALVAVTAGIGAFGLPILGAGFAAGSFGASALAAGVGIAGQLAISALTPPPSVPKGPGAARELSQAGIGQNIATPLETLSTLHGKMLVTPSVLAPAYTTLDNDEITVHAIAGIQGRSLVENPLLNGLDITLLESCAYETREGGPADAALTLCQLTCIQQTDQRVLKNFETESDTNKNSHLIDQTTPANSAPEYQYFRTDGEVDEFWIRHLFPNGIVKTSDGSVGALAIRYELRKVGDVAWRNGPTLHICDEDAGKGPIRVEVKFKLKRIGDGPHYNSIPIDRGFRIFAASYVTANGQAFAYTADSYFNGSAVPTDQIPVMTAATTSGVTMSASSTSGAQNAWLAADGNAATYWRPTDSSLPAWLKIDFGLGNTKTIYSYSVAIPSGGDNTQTPLEFYLQGSNDDSAWTDLSHFDGDPGQEYDQQLGWVETPAAYRYYRFYIIKNQGFAADQVRIGDIQLYASDASSMSISSGFNSQMAVGVSLNSNGADIFLDPASWSPGAYEVRVKRSYAFAAASLAVSAATYTYGGSAPNADFFEYRLSGVYYVIQIGQKNYRSDCNIEVFSSVSNDVPVDTTGIACIAVEIANTTVDSISAEMTSYAQEFDGTVWAETEVPTSNPAALYRKLLLGHAHPNPSPAEIINEDELAAWFTRCDTAGHECNFLQQGRSIAEVKQVIAAAGYASPRESNMLSIVEDYDRSAESISQVLSPLNSKLLGVNIPLPELEHAIYAEYFDAADDWKVRRDIFYRDGFDINTASFFSTITYDGFTDATRVATRAAFDLKQVIARARRVRREIGIEGYSLQRGSLIGHNDDVLDMKQAQGLIKSLELSGGNVVSMTVDNIIPFSLNQDDLAAFAEGLDLANATGVAIRLAAGTSIVKTLTNVSDGTICTFTTPFPLSDLGITAPAEAYDFMAVFGQAGRTHERMIVMAVEPQGLETRIIELAAEAPELFA